jgi:hypothetical protein
VAIGQSFPSICAEAIVKSFILKAVTAAAVAAACCQTAEAGRGWRISIGYGASGYSHGSAYGAPRPSPYYGPPAGYNGSPAGFYGGSGYGSGGFDSRYWYPKYYGGFHARYFQDIGYPSGDTNTFRGTPW